MFHPPTSPPTPTLHKTPFRERESCVELAAEPVHDGGEDAEVATLVLGNYYRDRFWTSIFFLFFFHFLRGTFTLRIHSFLLDILTAIYF